MTIKAEDLIAKGYEIKPGLGAVKDFGEFAIAVGYMPRNHACVSVRGVGMGATIVTAAKTLEDIEALERLLGEGAYVDSDYEE